MFSNQVVIADDGANGADPTPANNTSTVTSSLYQGVYAVALAGSVNAPAGGAEVCQPHVDLTACQAGRRWARGPLCPSIGPPVRRRRHRPPTVALVDSCPSGARREDLVCRA